MSAPRLTASAGGGGPRGRAPGGSGHWRLGGRALLLLLLCTVGMAATAAPADTPSVFLAGANVPRAKALALDAALLKGWRVAESEPDHVVFEILLDTPASSGPPAVAAGRLAPPPHTLLRIRADFSATDNGVTTALRAEEIWYAGTAEQWSDDVTTQYRANLMNALTSLRSQWAGLAPTEPAPRAPRRTFLQRLLPYGRSQATRAAPPTAAAAAPAESATPAPVRLPAPTPAVPLEPSAGSPAKLEAGPEAGPEPGTEPADDRVGVWAYYAEEFATARGCILSDRGAVLMSESEGTELHDVHCQGGSNVMVRCDRTGCEGGR